MLFSILGSINCYVHQTIIGKYWFGWCWEGFMLFSILGSINCYVHKIIIGKYWFGWCWEGGAAVAEDCCSGRRLVLNTNADKR